MLNAQFMDFNIGVKLTYNNVALGKHHNFVWLKKKLTFNKYKLLFFRFK